MCLVIDRSTLFLMAKRTNIPYQRDGRAPVPILPITSKVMSANKGKGTKPELAMRKAMYAAGIKGYRLNWKKAPGRPDIAFPGKKKAIFINGCFWHRCEKCNPNNPKSNIEFWEKKFSRNKERDLRKVEELQRLGWQVLVVWECEIKNGIHDLVATIKIKFLKY